jgi:hypothetical protein
MSLNRPLRVLVEDDMRSIGAVRWAGTVELYMIGDWEADEAVDHVAEFGWEVLEDVGGRGGGFVGRGSSR